VREPSSTVEGPVPSRFHRSPGNAPRKPSHDALREKARIGRKLRFGDEERLETVHKHARAS